MKRTYRALLRLYPYDYRYAFAAEMREAFEAAHAEKRSPSSYLRFAVSEVAFLVIGAAAEWKAKWTSHRSRRRALPDLRLMRPPEIHGSVWFARVHEGGSDAADV